MQMGESHRVSRPSAPNVAEMDPKPSVKVFRGVNLPQDFAVALPQHVQVHLRHNIGHAIHVVARGLPAQAALLL